MISISNALAHGSAHLATTVLPAVDNPFDHTTPSLEIFGLTFENKIYAVLGGVWGIVVVYLAYRLLIAIGKFASAKKVQHNPDALSDASVHLKVVAVALVLVGGITPLFAAITGVVS